MCVLYQQAGQGGCCGKYEHGPSSCTGRTDDAAEAGHHKDRDQVILSFSLTALNTYLTSNVP